MINYYRHEVRTKRNYYGSGDGSSVDNAVILKHFDSEKDIVTLQRKWIRRKCPYFLAIKIHKIQKKGKEIESFKYFPYDNDDMRKKLISTLQV